MPENIQKSIATILYLFIAALAPAITPLKESLKSLKRFEVRKPLQRRYQRAVWSAGDADVDIYQRPCGFKN